MTMLTALPVLEEAVNRGAKKLDEVNPGWFLQIDIDRIEPGCPDHSIPGQLFGPSVMDQMIAVGINFDADQPWKLSKDFAAMGFAVLMADVLLLPEEIKEKMREVSEEISALAGQDLSAIVKVPDAIPVPRDEDTVAGEAFALTYLWENVVKARLRG